MQLLVNEIISFPKPLQTESVILELEAIATLTLVKPQHSVFVDLSILKLQHDLVATSRFLFSTLSGSLVFSKTHKVLGSPGNVR